MDEEIRWIQRFDNYCKALAKLEEAVKMVDMISDESLIDLVKEGLILRFEFSHELSWKVMKDYLEYQGVAVGGSRDAFRCALNIGLIDDRNWMESIKARNLTSHTYDEEVVDGIFNDVINIYFPLMEKFKRKMEEIKEDERHRLDN